jgi:predicted RNase H-like HicB family nuclease
LIYSRRDGGADETHGGNRAEGEGYVSLCPELDVASQGKTIEEARDNLREALELFFESASPDEVKQRLRSEVFVTQIEVAVG